MKYKIGDKVRIKSKEILEYAPTTVSDMLQYADREAFISKVLGDDTYEIDIDNSAWVWADDMLEQPAEPTLFDRIKSAIIEAGKQTPIIIEQTEDGGVKISPLEEKEEDLPIDTPCMVADCLDNWCFRYYAYKGKVFMNGLKSKNEGKVMKYDYIIPFDKFNPLNIEESLKYNIVK